MKELAVRNDVPVELQEKVLMGGDLSKLTIPERLSYYKAVCESVGLNPLTRPFEYLVLDDKMVLYARKDCTDQLRDLHGISVEIACRERIDELFVVTARAKNMTERTDESIGAVPAAKEDGEWKTAQSGKRYFQGNGEYKPLSLEARANAMMKAETKAKRRVTLSICGLGILDESEIEDLQNAKRAVHAEDPDKTFSHAELVELTHEMPKEKAQDGLDRSSADTLQQTPHSTQQGQDAAPPADVFAESSAILEHELAFAECKTDDDYKAWTNDLQNDKRVSAEARKPLMDNMFKVVKALRTKK